MKKYLLPAVLFLIFSFQKIKAQDTEFMNTASQANLGEIEAAKLALSKSTSASVKSFASMMISDHKTAQDELTALANKKGIMLPASPDADHQQMKAGLMKLSGPAFDSVYLKSQYNDHQAAVSLFSNESANGTDPDAKAFAAKYLPKLQGHFDMVKKQYSHSHDMNDSTKMQ